jgi:hypothetical protein
MSCFYCQAPTSQLDWHCKHCSASFHHHCNGRRDRKQCDNFLQDCFSCGSCKRVFSDTTVAFWANGTYRHLQASREGSVLDVNYVYEGNPVGVLTFTVKNGQFSDKRFFISANIQEAVAAWSEEKWDQVRAVLEKIDLNE